ncbi:TRASH domain-containing protein [Geothrix paludis]|uniref:TRASH domain-containing protein n=1 Tax=Geothrix paludis TaxID=2922722 RepID=UPI001FAD6F60|nr:TRASH domain-containing protein [Geothrix paludis]
MRNAVLLTFTIIAAATNLEAAKPATNGRCPVLGNPVADRNQVVTVRERNYYVCCSDCGQQLTQKPDQFLDQEGRPRNASSTQTGGKVRDHY